MVLVDMQIAFHVNCQICTGMRVQADRACGRRSQGRYGYQSGRYRRGSIQLLFVSLWYFFQQMPCGKEVSNARKSRPSRLLPMQLFRSFVR